MRRGISLIVAGALNTDIVGFPDGRLHIGPGGKSRNIAEMASVLMGKGKVAMVARTSRDAFGLWKPPLEALKKAGVDTSCVNVERSGKFPGIAFITVDREGKNDIRWFPGITDDFSQKYIDMAEKLFKKAGKGKGVFVLSLEMPLATARHAIRKAGKWGLRILLDPGGSKEGVDCKKVLGGEIFLIKPNEEEAEALTEVKVKDLSSAGKAAGRLMEKGAENVLITAGRRGAYLFTGSIGRHIPVPEVKEGKAKDSTGCGDETMAALCAFLSEGKSIERAAELAVLAGTLEFHRAGIVPVTRKEMRRYAKV